MILIAPKNKSVRSTTVTVNLFGLTFHLIHILKRIWLLKCHLHENINIIRAKRFNIPDYAQMILSARSNEFKI